jgi:KUP system potassium uptake protein
LTVAALGVVFGDIGTSPLYTLKACMDFGGGKPVLEDVLGICSLLIWTLVLVVCLKYAAFIMRVDHDGEGGILALLALGSRTNGNGGLAKAGALTIVVVVGASMLFGDGLITPAISVISAIEGIDEVSKAAHPYIVPLAVLILIALFGFQARGTEKVGRLFGPVMIAWFAALAVAGAIAIASHPAVLWALSPLHAVRFMTHHGSGGFFVLGGVVLAVTGVEALYADLSHFGRRPIVRAWYLVVFPALVLAYLGQGARIIVDPHNLDNALYALTPGGWLIPMVVLATAATVIASQALISGAFTLAEQAIALGLAPRMEVRHTSRRMYGEVYVPALNYALAVGCIILVVTFRSSDRLAAAYGLAVSVTMLTTSIAYYTVVRRALHWPQIRALPLLLAFVAIDGSFVIAGLPKLLDGGWLPIAISVVLTTVALTWLEGRRRLRQALIAQQTPVAEALKMLPSDGEPAGTMVFLTADPTGIPFLAHHRWVRARAREERIILLHLEPTRKPYLHDTNRVTIEHLSPRLIRVDGRFGYMEPPRIAPIVRACAAQGLLLNDAEMSFFYADPKIEHVAHGAMQRWQRVLFAFLQRNSRPLPDDLHIPAERRVELGLTVRI